MEVNQTGIALILHLFFQNSLKEAHRDVDQGEVEVFARKLEVRLVSEVHEKLQKRIGRLDKSFEVIRRPVVALVDVVVTVRIAEPLWSVPTHQLQIHIC